MTAVRLQGRIALHHTRWHTKWKLFFEVSHTIKMTHCYAAHLGFSLLFLKKKQLTTNWKQKSHGLRNVSVSGVSKQPCLLVKASDLLLVRGWLKPRVFYSWINWWTLLSPLISQTWPKPAVYVLSWHLDERKKQRPLPHLCTAQSILSEASKNNTNFHDFLLSHELLLPFILNDQLLFN